MQRFVAELSNAVERTAFEKSWQTDPSRNDAQPSVEFKFAGQRVSVVVNSDSSTPWPSVTFHQTFAAAIRRVDRSCNVRWL
jgi:hypothetical protein